MATVLNLNEFSSDENYQRLKKLLTEFTTQYLIDNPEDDIDYAYKYFHQLKFGETPHVEIKSEMENDLVTAPNRPRKRRKKVFVDSYDPSNDDSDFVVIEKTDEEKQLILNVLKSHYMFKALDDSQLEIIAGAMQAMTVDAGDIILGEGGFQEEFFIVQSGVFQSTSSSKKGVTSIISVYDNNGWFGDLAIMAPMHPLPTVTCVVDGKVWMISHDIYRKIVIRTSYLKLLNYRKLLDSVSFFEHLHSHEKETLAEILKCQTYSDGQTIFHQGDIPDGMYIVEEGNVLIRVRDPETPTREIDVTKLKENDCFGELALLTKQPRSASAYADGPTKLAFLEVDAFERLLGPCIDIMKRSSLNFNQRLMDLFAKTIQYSSL